MVEHRGAPTLGPTPRRVFGRYRGDRDYLAVVEVRNEGVFIDGRRALRRKHIAWGWIDESEHKPALLLFDQTGDRRAVFSLESRREGEQTLRALGIVPGTSVELVAAAGWSSRFARWSSVPFGAACGLLMYSQPTTGYVLLSVLAGIGVAFFAARAYRKIGIGSDGLWIGATRRFVPYEDLMRVNVRHQFVRLHLPGDRVVTLTCAGTMPAKTVARCILEARASHRAGAPPAQALLARGDSEPQSWIERLDALAHGYRVAAPTREALWSVVESPLADVSARMAAARLLAPQLDDRDRPRMEQAARSTAAPRVRVVLEEAAAGKAGVIDTLLLAAERDPSEARLRR